MERQVRPMLHTSMKTASLIAKKKKKLEISYWWPNPKNPQEAVNMPLKQDQVFPQEQCLYH